MTVSATITRRRRARADSSWDFEVGDDTTTVKGSIVCASSDDDIAFERAGWRAVDIVGAIIDEVSEVPVPIIYVGLPPHPAGQKTEPAATMNITTTAPITSSTGGFKP